VDPLQFLELLQDQSRNHVIESLTFELRNDLALVGDAFAALHNPFLCLGQFSLKSCAVHGSTKS
jgi:hypothetical protein